jgi:hypothetical protein
LEKDAWVIGPRRVTLEVPIRSDLRPGAKALKINHPRSGEALELKREGDRAEGNREPDRGGRAWLYHYRPVAPRRIVYRPGDEVWAYLELADGRFLKWRTSPSARYLILRLRQPPRLLRNFTDDYASGSEQPGVRLTFTPPDEVPPVPELMPRES